MGCRLFNPGCIQRENRWTIRKWICVIFLLVLFVFLLLHFIRQSFHYCSGPFGDSSHLQLSWHDNYNKFMKGKCSEGHDLIEKRKIDKLSFIARLIYNYENRREAICAGTLIFDDIVVTAAHCLTDINFANLEVHLGSPSEIFTNLTENDIKIHNKYDNEKFTNDIALIRLNRKLNSSVVTSTLCIPFDEKEIRKNLTMGEWNIVDIKINDPKIIETTVNGIDHTKCGQEFYNLVEIVHQSKPSNQLPERNKKEGIKSENLKEIRFEQFCAGNKSVKRGNSGMPVYGNDLNTGAPTIYGFVSFGVKMNHGSNLPTVFTKIYDYRHWILCHAY